MCLSEACNDCTDHSLLLILGCWLLNLHFKVTAASAARKEMKCCQEKVFKQPWMRERCQEREAQLLGSGERAALLRDRWRSMWANERQPPRYHTDLVLGNAVTCVHYHFSEVMFVIIAIWRHSIQHGTLLCYWRHSRGRAFRSWI